MAWGLALAALFAGCKVTKYLNVTSEPTGAHTDFRIGGKWYYMGQTPTRFSYYHDAGARAGLFKVTVGVRKKGYYSKTWGFVAGYAPEEKNMHFELAPIHEYSFTIESNPPGAMIEYYGQVKVFDTNQGLWVPTDKWDWMVWGNTPLETKFEDVEGDRTVVIRVTKPGHQTMRLNLTLGEDKYPIELEADE